jgi:hypothetical protein
MIGTTLPHDRITAKPGSTSDSSRGEAEGSPHRVE